MTRRDVLKLADPRVLAGFGFNPREIQFLSREPWWQLSALYLAPYLDAFHDEYRPFDAGLNHLDQATYSEVLKKDGASAAAIRFIGGSASALHVIWHAALLKLRGVPLFPTEVFRIKGGNQTITDAFTARLSERVRLGCPVTGIERGGTCGGRPTTSRPGAGCWLPPRGLHVCAERAGHLPARLSGEVGGHRAGLRHRLGERPLGHGP